MSEQFSLHWDNFHKNMRTGMQSLLESEDLVDVTLAVEGRYLKAHKMVLSLCSPYFRELFQMNPCKHPIVFMKDVSYVALSDLLQFMYQGEVQVAQENLTTFIKTAEALQIKGLTGDSNSQNDETIEQIEEERPPRVIEPIKRTHEMRVPETVQTPPQIKRRFGPPIKRPKISPQNQTNISVATASNVEHPPVEAILTDDHIQTSNNLVQMKVEPSETSSSVQLKEGEISDSRDEYPEDTLIEDETIDIEEDSVLMEATEDDPKPGTSTEDIGDGQEDINTNDYKIIETKQVSARKKRSTTRNRFVFGGFVYHNKLVAGKPPIRYLACAEMKKTGCRSRAILPVNGNESDLRITAPHNHPGDEFAEEKDSFQNHLRNAARTMPGSLKRVYDNIAVLYPNGARELSFKSMCSSLHRWRRSCKESDENDEN